MCKGPVAERSMARVSNERRPTRLGSLGQRVWGGGRDHTGLPRSLMLSEHDASYHIDHLWTSEFSVSINISVVTGN